MTHSSDLVPGVMHVLPTASGRSQPDSGLGRYGDCSAPFCAAIGNSVATPGKLLSEIIRRAVIPPSSVLLEDGVVAPDQKHLPLLHEASQVKVSHEEVSGFSW